MNTHPKSPETNTPKSKTSATTLTPQPPKLLLPTILSFLCSALLFAITNLQLFSHYLPLPMLFRDMLNITLAPITTTLALFLLHRLLEVIIIRRTFHPRHLFTVAAILLSIAPYYHIPALTIVYLILYAIAGIIFAASLSFQKSHFLATDPAHFRSSLLSTSTANLILGFFNLCFFIPTSLGATSSTLSNILFEFSIFILFPLQLTLTLLTLTKFRLARSANLLPSAKSTNKTTKTANSTDSPSIFSRFDFFIITASLIFTLISITAFLATVENMLAEDYSHRQPCCHQPTYYEN